MRRILHPSLLQPRCDTGKDVFGPSDTARATRLSSIEIPFIQPRSANSKLCILHTERGIRTEQKFTGTPCLPSGTGPSPAQSPFESPAPDNIHSELRWPDPIPLTDRHMGQPPWLSKGCVISFHTPTRNTSVNVSGASRSPALVLVLSRNVVFLPCD